MHYMLVAGEASGDLHASHLIRALNQRDSDATFTFLGGDLMTDAAGVDPIVHICDMAYMGFSEVLRNLGAIRRNMKKAKKTLIQGRPDALILIDYPSFNLKLAKIARTLGIPVFYYISPKVWAWKEHRVKAIKRLVDRMFVVFPFEEEFYRIRHDYEVEFVGNPSLSEVEAHLASLPGREDFMTRHKLRLNRPLIALLPGSRIGEIRNNLEVMTQVVSRFPQYRGVIAGAPNIPDEVYRRFSELPIVRGETLTLLAHSNVALVTSGTATLEAALVGIPQVACYRSNGSHLAYNIMKRLLHVPFVTLPNLIAEREVIPELLLHNCTPDVIFEQLIPLLRDTPVRKAMLEGYADVRKALTAPGDPADNTARRIIELLHARHA